jgi:hypothetical protein
MVKWLTILLIFALQGRGNAESAPLRKCEVLSRLAGKWNWQTSTHANSIPGTFSFTHDTPSDVARLQMIGYYPQSERSSKDLFSIDLAEHGGIRRATHTSGDLKIANCSVEVQDDKGMLILTCESGYPPRLSFLSISRNEVRFQFLGPPPHHHAKYVPYLSATAQRHRNSTNH